MQRLNATMEPTTESDARDAETGRFEQKHDKTKFLETLRALEGMAGTQEVADEAAAPYTTTYDYLRELEAEGEVARRKVANANLWEVADS